MVIGGHRRSVVVKVRHPGVEVRIKQDFQILKPLAFAASKVRPNKQVYTRHYTYKHMTDSSFELLLVPHMACQGLADFVELQVTSLDREACDIHNCFPAFTSGV